MSTEQFTALFDRFGVAGTLLVAIIIGGWRILRWIAPRADEFLKKQFDLVDTLKDTITRSKQILDGMIDTLKGVSDSIQSVLSNQEEIRRDIGEIKHHVGLHKRKDG